jgi:hypothetical protein
MGLKVRWLVLVLVLVLELELGQGCFHTFRLCGLTTLPVSQRAQLQLRCMAG